MQGKNFMNVNVYIIGKIYYNLKVILQQKTKKNLHYAIGNVNIHPIKHQNTVNFLYGIKKKI